MDSSVMDDIVRRLVADPHDEAALATAHASGEEDPHAYATLLSRVAERSEDPVLASHWLSEAAQVFAVTLSDLRRAATLFMEAIERDAANDLASERLVALYLDRGDKRAVVALYERRVKSLTARGSGDPEIHAMLARLHEDLGRLWQEPPFSQPKRALEHFRKAFEWDPGCAGAIYAARELLKEQGELQQALPLYALELRAVEEFERKVLLLREEAEVRRELGDLRSATACLRDARRLVPNDEALNYELATCVVTRVHNGEAVPREERIEAAALLDALADEYDGELRLAYAQGALDALPGDDHAMRLALKTAQSLGREHELQPNLLAYLQHNPTGQSVEEVRVMLATFTGDSVPGTSSTRLGDVVSAAERNRMLARGAELAASGDKDAALAQYRSVLAVEPDQPEALAFVEDTLRSRREYAALRDVLLAAARGGTNQPESRRSRLREVANLSEVQLRDEDGAIGAYRQLLSLDRGDETSRAALDRLLTKREQWDDLAALIERDATSAASVQDQIALERRLADLHRDKRSDPRQAAEALLRIVRRTPRDEAVLLEALQLLEQAEDLPSAVAALEDVLPNVEGEQRGRLTLRLAELQERLDNDGPASEAFSEAAELLRQSSLWKRAEDAAVRAERWETAATAIEHWSNGEKDEIALSRLRSREADYLVRAGDPVSAILRIEQAIALTPEDDDVAAMLERLYEQEGRLDDLADFLVRRAAKLGGVRTLELLKRAATFRRDRLADADGARALWMRIAEATEDVDALSALVDDAVAQGQPQRAITFLQRLQTATTTREASLDVMLREASLLADAIGDVDAALVRYWDVIERVDPTCRQALQAIARLEASRQHFAEAVDAYERELALINSDHEREAIARRIAVMASEHLGDLARAVPAYEIVVALAPNDGDALAQLHRACVASGHYARAVEVIDRRLEMEKDEANSTRLKIERAELVADRLGEVDEALRWLAPLAAHGVEAARTVVRTIGEKHDALARVGELYLEWSDIAAGPDATRYLSEAYDAFVRGGAEGRALEVAPEILRTARGRDPEFLRKLEEMAEAASDTELVLEVHERRASAAPLGEERARELLRQARVRIDLGLDEEEALAHGEAALASLPPEDADAYLDALALLAKSGASALALFERQIARAKGGAQRLPSALRAYARVLDEVERRPEERDFLLTKARELTEVALASAGGTEPFDKLYALARSADLRSAGAPSQAASHRRALFDALTGSSAGGRDGGRSRSAQLLSAAELMVNELSDMQGALPLVVSGLVAFVDAANLEAVERILGGDPRHLDDVLTRALAEVTDGAPTRQMLTRRASLRSELLGDREGALEDYRRLHELTPGDPTIVDRYRALLLAKGDHRGLVQLLEAQILRTKDPLTRSELAREVALLWEEPLVDFREAADAWRRVLRLRPQDAEATQGLERAKRNMLRTSSASPPRMSDPAPPPSSAGARVESDANVANEPSLPALEDEAAESSSRPTRRDDVIADHGLDNASSVSTPPVVAPLEGSTLFDDMGDDFASWPQLRAADTSDFGSSGATRSSAPPPLQTNLGPDEALARSKPGASLMALASELPTGGHALVTPSHEVPAPTTPREYVSEGDSSFESFDTPVAFPVPSMLESMRPPHRGEAHARGVFEVDEDRDLSLLDVDTADGIDTVEADAEGADRGEEVEELDVSDVELSEEDDDDPATVTFDSSDPPPSSVPPALPKRSTPK